MFWFHRKPVSAGRFEIPKGVQPSVDDSGLVLFCLRRGLLFRANQTGAAIWAGLLEGREQTAVAADVSERFGIAPARAAEDVGRFVESLVRSELLYRQGGGR